jgi:hypothetical protein
MRVNSSTRYAAIAILVGALACAGNTARDTETDADQAAAARDTTISDTLAGDVQNPPGYRGMERDTAIAPPGEQPSDTFLQNQGTGGAQDTSGYSGLERADTSGQVDQGGQMDTTGMTQDTAGSGGDTTGYNPTQPMDTTSAR